LCQFLPLSDLVEWRLRDVLRFSYRGLGVAP
jgi:hypothetical protein